VNDAATITLSYTFFPAAPAAAPVADAGKPATSASSNKL
jgi:cytochrome c oxidase assembly protein Cox11